MRAKIVLVEFIHANSFKMVWGRVGNTRLLSEVLWVFQSTEKRALRVQLCAK